jgi:crossover junction endodeoxyribonuclease RusA
MSDPITIYLELIPPTLTSQQKGVRIVNKVPHFFEKPEVKKALDAVADELKAYKPARPLEGPIELTIQFVYPWRAQDLASRAKAALCKLIRWDWHTARPDTANVAKGIIDRMTKLGFWLDDGQICDERYRKKRGERPSISITIRELPWRAQSATPGDPATLFEVEGCG